MKSFYLSGRLCAAATFLLTSLVPFSFYGTSTNAVKSQIWIAICVYLMVACFNKMHGINENLSRILQVVSVNVFLKDPVNQLLAKFQTMDDNDSNSNQLMFNDF